MKYRSDIDGLRAVAVLSVVIFHYFPSLLPGGFIGVDIFFVISGFLIGTIIISEIKNNSFSFMQFYKRRALRIFPALIFILIFCYIVGFSSLYQNELASLGKHIAAGSGFVSNLVLWSESGYFDVSSNTKPLLHLWSLGVEEQFYIVSPVILIIAFRLKKSFSKTCATLITVSFLYCLWTMYSNSTANYYSPMSRLWELMFGVLLAALIAEFPRFTEYANRYANIISITGLALLTLSLIIINEKISFPGYIALLPVIASCLIITTGSHSVICRRLFSFKPLVFIGLVSYPFYLWHWPILTFLRIIYGSDTSERMRVIALLLSFVLACATYYLIEKPIRFGIKIKGEHKAVSLAIVLLAVFSLGMFTFINSGISSRDFNKINASRNTGDTGDIAFIAAGCGMKTEQIGRVPFCVHDNRGSASYALIGDSKSMALFGGVIKTSLKGKYWIYVGGNSSTTPPKIVMPVFSNDQRYSCCQDASRAAIDAISENKDIKVVVYTIASRAIFQLKTDDSIEDMPQTKNYDLALNGLLIGVDQLVNAGKKIVFVIDNPTLAHPEDCMGRKTTISLLNNILSNINKKCEITTETQLKLSEKYRSLLNKIKEKHPSNVYLFDTLPFMCTDGVCSHRKDGHFMYAYTDHISGYAAGIVGGALNKFLAEIPDK